MADPNLRAALEETGGLTRRRLLTSAASTGAALAGAGLLAACGSSGSSSGSSTSTSGPAPIKSVLPGAVAELPGGTPRRGGTLTLGTIGSGQAETLWPGAASVLADWSRQYNLYNFLLYPGVDENPIVPGLAVSWESNPTATVWTFHLRPGVTFHDGTPFTAADIVYNFQIWSNAATNYGAAYLTGLVDLKRVRARGKLTVEVPLLRPVAAFPTILTYFNFGVVKQGATAKEASRNPIGTGPFRFESFTPGQQSTFVAYQDYWETGRPYVDKLIVQSQYTDVTSSTNALLGGVIDLLPAPPIATAIQQLSTRSIQVLAATVSSQNFCIGMRVDKGPFADNRVRQAFKLLADRHAMVNSGFSGAGTVCADLLAVPTDPYYLTDARPVHDVERAKSLFKAAGVAGQTFGWPSADYLPGAAQALILLAQEAPAAGVKIAIKNQPFSTYFTPAGGAYTRYAGTNVWQPAPSLLVLYLAALAKNAPFHDTWWCHQPGGRGVPTGAASAKLIDEAISATDPAKAKDLWHECQQQQRDYGGYIVWGNQPYIDAAGLKVRGLKAGAGLNYNNFRFQDAWLTA